MHINMKVQKNLINFISLLKNLVKLLKSTYMEFNHLASKDAGKTFPPWIWTLADFSDFDKIFQEPSNTEI